MAGRGSGRAGWRTRLRNGCGSLAGTLDAAITGSVITLDGGRYYNRLLWASPAGVRHYDKRHLFRMGREHEHFTAGRTCLERGLARLPYLSAGVLRPEIPGVQPSPPGARLRAAGICGELAGGARRCLAAAAAGAGHREPGVRRRRQPCRRRRPGGAARAATARSSIFSADPSPRRAMSRCVLERGVASRAAHRVPRSFPAHLDADRFTLEL